MQASVRRTATWVEPRSLPRPNLDHLDDDERITAGRSWTAIGLAEHASVASFAVFVQQLLAVGAPRDLVSSAIVAMADEVTHARLAFELASAYLGHHVGPDRLETNGNGEHDCTLISVAVATVRDGCVAEALSAYVLASLADATFDATVRSVLRRLSEDEERHAVLAYRFVAWAVQQGGPEIRHAVRDAFEDCLATHARCTAATATAMRENDARTLEAYGLEHVVKPCARAFLA